MSVKVSSKRREELRGGRLGCHYCPERAESWDHVVPRYLGGSEHEVNIVPSCRPCNEAKAAHMPTCQCGPCRAAVLQWRRSLGRAKRRLVVARARARAAETALQLAEVLVALSEPEACPDDREGPCSR